MVRVNLKGIAKVTAKGRTYWYAWRGGPRLRGEPGTAEFIASYREAHESLRAPDTSPLPLPRGALQGERRIREARRHRPSAIGRPGSTGSADYFGDLRIAQFDRPEKIPAGHPPMAQSLGRQASHRRLWPAGSLPRPVLRRRPARQDRRQPLRGHQAALQRRPLRNHLDRLPTSPRLKKHVLRGDRVTRSILRLTPGCASAICCGLSWSHVGDDAITITTGKSKQRREAIIPLYDGLREVLAAIPKRVDHGSDE